MWLSLFLSVVVICFTVDNMFANYLSRKYPTKDEHPYGKENDDAQES